MFVQGETVRLTAFHRTEDQNGVVVSLNVAHRLIVAGHVTGSPDVRCRFPERPSRTVLVPAVKLRKCAPVDDPDQHDGDHSGGGPVGAAAAEPVPVEWKREGYPPARRRAA